MENDDTIERDLALKELDHIKKNSMCGLLGNFSKEVPHVHCFKDIQYDDEHPIIIITGRDINVHVYLMNDGTIESVVLNGSSFINIAFKQVLSHFCDEYVKSIWEGSKYTKSCKLARFNHMGRHIKELQNNLNDAIKLRFV